MSFGLVKQIGQTLNSTNPPTTMWIIETVTLREIERIYQMKQNFTGSAESAGSGFLKLIIFGADWTLSLWLLTTHGGGSGLVRCPLGSLLHKMLNVTQVWSFDLKKKQVWSYLRWMLWVALYWNGISIRAASAKAASFLEGSLFSDMIFEKFTNCKRKGNVIKLQISEH